LQCWHCAGIRIAKADYIPDVGAFAQYTYQNGVPFLVHNNGSVGLRMSWKVFDWGKRSAAIGEAKLKLCRPKRMSSG
jgi:outer membrane protein TolC